ncbi:hypothetical protein D3C85_1423390 [compost metagenome]
MGVTLLCIRDLQIKQLVVIDGHGSGPRADKKQGLGKQRAQRADQCDGLVEHQMVMPVGNGDGAAGIL